MRSIFYFIFKRKLHTTFDSIAMMFGAILFYTGDIALAITLLIICNLISVFIELGVS